MKYFLASTSPRRIELMRLSGLPWSVLPPECEERLIPGENGPKMVKRLAILKASSVLGNAGKGPAIVLGADTTVERPDGRGIFEKPETKKDAVRMLQSLSGHEHIVYTGYCLIGIKEGRVFGKFSRVVKTKVKFRELSPEWIKAYVESGEPMDKAGAYGAQGLGQAMIESIRGSYTNVVGLPLAQVLSDLEALHRHG